MIKKHNLFLATLQAGENSEKKVAGPLDQALLACSLMESGEWRKASLARSFIGTALWSLSGIDAHWCRSATTGNEEYIPFSPVESPLITISEVEPPNDPDVLTNTSLHEVNANDPSYDETDESEEEDNIATSDDELPHGLDFGEIDMVELEETLQRISRVLDTPDSPNSESGQARPLNSLAIRQ